MEILQDTPRLLRNAGYQTWLGTTSFGQTVCFEDDTIFGVVYSFPSVGALLSGWEKVESEQLIKYASAFKQSGQKSWNVYSIFLTSESTGSHKERFEVQKIDENFRRTRKIARAGVKVPADLRQALMPLLPLENKSEIVGAAYEVRLSRRLSEIPPRVLNALLRNAEPRDIAQMLAEEKK